MNKFFANRINAMWGRVLKGVALLASLPIAYVLIYAMLSLFGRYRPISESDLSHFDIFSEWAPLGFYDSHPSAGSLDAKWGGNWRVNMIEVFYPLWTVDVCHVHKRHDLYMSGRLVGDKWICTTNSSLHLP